MTISCTGMCGSRAGIAATKEKTEFRFQCRAAQKRGSFFVSEGLSGANRKSITIFHNECHGNLLAAALFARIIAL